MAVEQEEKMEEDDITHQPSQEEEIPREPRQGVQMYDHDPWHRIVVLHLNLNTMSVFMTMANY